MLLVDELEVRLRELVARIEVDRSLELENRSVRRGVAAARGRDRVEEREDAEHVRGGGGALGDASPTGSRARAPPRRRHAGPRPRVAELGLSVVAARAAEEHGRVPEREVVADPEQAARPA